MNYLRAHTLDQALTALAEPGWCALAGGTDIYAEGAQAVAAGNWVDISRIAALRGISEQAGEVRIGATTAWEDIASSPLLPRALREAAQAIGSLQIRLQGSIGGNLCHASPVADGVPPLLTLNAKVELASTQGIRLLPIDQFLLGRRHTALQTGELLTAVHFTLPALSERTAFIKLANREGTALATVSAAVRLRLTEAGNIKSAAIAVGAASAVPARLRSLEGLLLGRHHTAARQIIADASLPELAPIDDCRGPAWLRMQLAHVAIERVCASCLQGDAHVALA